MLIISTILALCQPYLSNHFWMDYFQQKQWLTTQFQVRYPTRSLHSQWFIDSWLWEITRSPISSCLRRNQPRIRNHNRPFSKATLKVQRKYEAKKAAEQKASSDKNQDLAPALPHRAHQEVLSLRWYLETPRHEKVKTQRRPESNWTLKNQAATERAPTAMRWRNC